MTIRAGEKVAVVGASGAGKSTHVNLLLGFYSLTKGRILVDGVDMSTLSLEGIRRDIAIVEQEPSLFSTTIRENIRYGTVSPEVSDDAVRTAAVDAYAHEFIREFPESYETSVGARGVQLSGGQNQRGAIARALLRNPKLLVLDKATSALDSESETKVQSALERVMKARTTIIVAHRLSMIAHADRVVVLRDGKILQQSHDGYYQQLVAGQMLRSA